MPTRPGQRPKSGCWNPLSSIDSRLQRIRRRVKLWFAPQKMGVEGSRRNSPIAVVQQGPPKISLPYPEVIYGTWKHRRGPPLERYFRGSTEYRLEGEVFARPISMPLALNPVFGRPIIYSEFLVPNRPPKSNIDGLDDLMHPSTVMAIVAWLSKSLSHLPFLVTGLAAMIIHGYTGRFAKHVTIMCPDHSVEVLMSWAHAQKDVLKLGEGTHEFGVRLADDRGRVRRIRVRSTPSRIWDFRAAVSVLAEGDDYGPTGTRIMGLEALLDVVAEVYVATRGGPGGTVMQEELAEEITWLVHRIMTYEKRVDREQIQHFLHPIFLEAFDVAFSEAGPLFIEAGLVKREEGRLVFDDGERPITMMTVDSDVQNFLRYDRFVEEKQDQKASSAERSKKGQRQRRRRRRGQTAPMTEPGGSAAAARYQVPPTRKVREGKDSKQGQEATKDPRPAVPDAKRPSDAAAEELGPIPVYELLRGGYGEVPDLPLPRFMWTGSVTSERPLGKVFREVLTPT